MYSFVKFIRDFIDFEPLHWDRVGEPEDHLGLSIVTFPCCRNKQIHIECGENRQIYCECLDYSYYKEGEVIPLGNNDMRTVLINYVDLKTDSDAQELGNIINTKLMELYRFHDKRDPINQILYRQMMFNDYLKEINERLKDLKG